MMPDDLPVDSEIGSARTSAVINVHNAHAHKGCVYQWDIELGGPN